MSTMAPISFEALMPSNVPASGPIKESVEVKHAQIRAGTALRAFNKHGIEQALSLLKKIRIEKSVNPGSVDDLLEDEEYSRPVDGYYIDKERLFNTKLELCEYFTSIFDPQFLEAHRKDSGLWTWIALAYFQQFIKTKNDTVNLASDARWVFDPDNYRLSMRHFVAGPLYLHYDFYQTGDEVKDMLFSSSPKEFGGFIDAITYKMEGTRLPVLMKVAAWLYYDASSPKKMKKGVISQDKPGTVREFLRVVSQLAQTRDFYGVEDAPALWNVLPKQFDGFKGDVQHWE